MYYFFLVIFVIFLAMFGWAFIHSSYMMCREKEGSPVPRFFAAIGGLIIGAMYLWTAIFVLITNPVESIFCLAVLGFLFVVSVRDSRL